MLLYEHRPELVRTDTPMLVQNCDLEQLQGFQSLFGFPEETVRHIRDTESMRGLSKYRLYADTLFVDFDDAEKAFMSAITTLRQLELGYSSYTTGNRGYHIHIDLHPIYGYTLPQRMKYYVTKMFPGADNLIYKCSGIIRLPLTVHSKTGKQKELIEEVKGQKLHLPDRVLLPGTKKPAKDRTKEEDMSYLINKISSFVAEGGRNSHCFDIAATCSNIGFNKAQTLDVVETWNTNLKSPLQHQEIRQVINSAYRK